MIIRKIQLACMSSILAMSIAHASHVPCNGFELKIKNSTADDFLVSHVQLKGADIQPNGFQKLQAHSEQVFIVNNSANEVGMKGVFEFHSISLPVKKTKLVFNLKNKKLVCEHNDNGSVTDYTSVDASREIGKVTYTIK